MQVGWSIYDRIGWGIGWGIGWMKGGSMGWGSNSKK